MDGWIKLHRKVTENPIACKDSDHLAVWVYLLLNATHREYQSVFMGEKITLKPGQLITGRKVISEKLKISESKVQRVLKSFENEQQIEQQNGNKNRLISIVSWSEYQSDEQQNEQLVNNKRTTTEQQLNTYKNVKKEKNERSNKEYPESSVVLTSYLIDLMKSNNPKVKIPVSLDRWYDEMDKLERLDKYDYEQVRSAIHWCQNDEFWKGVILSVPKLRAKMGTLIMQMQRKPQVINGGHSKKETSFERMQRMVREETEREASGHY